LWANACGRPFVSTLTHDPFRWDYLTLISLLLGLNETCPSWVIHFSSHRIGRCRGYFTVRVGLDPTQVLLYLFSTVRMVFLWQHNLVYFQNQNTSKSFLVKLNSFRFCFISACVGTTLLHSLLFRDDTQRSRKETVSDWASLKRRILG